MSGPETRAGGKRAGQARPVVRFARAEREQVGFQTRNQSNSLPEARLTFPNTGPELEFAGPVEILAGPIDGIASEAPTILFQGFPTFATHDEGVWTVDAAAAPELVEQTVGLFTITSSRGEHFYTLLRRAGLTRAQTRNTDPEPDCEEFTVTVPVVGVRPPDAPTDVGGVVFTNLGPSSDPGGPFAAAFEAISTRWGTPTALASVKVSESMLFDAGASGVGRIQRMLDSLLVEAAYGHSVTPSGTPIPFVRGQLRARPAVLPVVAVEASSSGRRTIHSLVGDTADAQVDLTRHVEYWSDELGQTPPLNISLGLESLRDAADERRGIIARCDALSSALSFYVAGVKLPRKVSRAALDQVREAIRGLDITDDERTRLEAVLGSANEPP